MENDVAELRATYVDKDCDIGVCVETSEDRTWAKLEWTKWILKDYKKVKILKYGWMPMRVLKKLKSKQ